MAGEVIETRNFRSTRGRNPNYMVRIDSTSGVSLVADIPEQISFSISNSWEPRFGAGLNEVAGGLGDLITRGSGENVMIQAFSRLMWMNTSPIEVPLTLMFDTYEDSYKDVYLPMNALELLSLPDVQGSFLVAPGPSVVNPNRNRITLFIGRAWYFPSVVITSVTSQYDSRFDANGWPISGQCDITFSTDKVYGKQDWAATEKRRGP